MSIRDAVTKLLPHFRKMFCESLDRLAGMSRLHIAKHFDERQACRPLLGPASAEIADRAVGIDEMILAQRSG